MLQRFNIQDLLKTRADQSSFHIASEKNVRVEFFNMEEGGQLDPFSYEGDLVITCYAGAFVLGESSASITLTEMDQTVVPSGSRVTLECRKQGTLQIIWAPAFAKVVKG